MNKNYLFFFETGSKIKLREFKNKNNISELLQKKAKKTKKYQETRF
jgi:hypothetical protein